MLSVFCSFEVNNTQKSKPTQVVSLVNKRPEMCLYNSQLELIEIKEKALDTQLRSKLELFTQSFYGHPGLNMFEDMMNRKWSLNGTVGVKLSWNVSVLYAYKNDKARLDTQQGMIRNVWEVFPFNNRLEKIQRSGNINRYQTMTKSDDEIIVLCVNVCKATGSKLTHGIIDVISLLREINNENAVKMQQIIHETDMFKEMYNLKYTNNE